MEDQRVSEGAARALLSDLDGSNDAVGGGVNGLSLKSSPLRIAAPASVGDWPCACGQRYRVLTDPLTFWPQNSRRGYRPEPSNACVSCDVDLAETFGLEAARLVSASILS
jgi:hypothetical protein